MKNEKLKVGIAGYGVVGKRRRNCIDLNPNLTTVAVSEITLSGEGEFPDGVKYFNNYNRLFDQKLDVLFVCLPNYLASAVTILGLKHGLHVFCEKPPACYVEDVRKVIEGS